MASKGLRAISYQVTRKVEAGYKPSHTTETLIGYIVCYKLAVFVFRYLVFQLGIKFFRPCVWVGKLYFH
jgi:hypothetical protein